MSWMRRNTLEYVLQPFSNSLIIQIESIKSCIKKTSERLRDTILQLETETGRNSFLRPDNTEEYTKQRNNETTQLFGS